MFLPCEDDILRKMVNERPSSTINKKKRLPDKIERAMAKIIEKEIELGRKIEILRRDLELEIDYS